MKGLDNAACHLFRLISKAPARCVRFGGSEKTKLKVKSRPSDVAPPPTPGFDRGG